jgi:hypothetical protein
VFEAYERRTLSYLANAKAREFWQAHRFRFSESF